MNKFFALGVATAVAVFVSSPDTAEAKCKFGYKSLGGSVRKAEDRGFSLVPGSTVIGVTADNEKRKLSFVVRRPDNSIVCEKGPTSSDTCAFEVSARNQGAYKVTITNHSEALTSYQISCSDG